MRLWWIRSKREESVGGCHAGARRAGRLLKDSWDCGEKGHAVAEARQKAAAHTREPFWRLEKAEA